MQPTEEAELDQMLVDVRAAISNQKKTFDKMLTLMEHLVERVKRGV